MSWSLLALLALVFVLALAAVLARRAELVRMRGVVRAREETLRLGDAEARLRLPVVDLSRCLGCATCVAVCPEKGVLGIVHGQATVVNGARCQGVSACERECPAGAITVTLADLAHRRDVPVVGPDLEVPDAPGLFLAGEVTAHALVKTAVEHGTAVAARVAARVGAGPALPRGRRTPSRAGARGPRRHDAPPSSADATADEPLPGTLADGVLDLCVVGAGPAGLACSLEAKRRGLRFETLEQEPVPGGTVARYPREKLVLTEPVELPLVGRLARRSYAKEELVALWSEAIAREALPVRAGVTFTGLERAPDGSWRVHTSAGARTARHVCLALGRRGTPRRLGVPGEELPKVRYDLLDARAHRGRRVLVVGGGDSAVEAALALARQPGNRVALSYRRAGFFRVRERSRERLGAAVAEGRLETLLESRVRAIRPEAVELELGAGGELRVLPNDEVFVMAGGVPPFELLERSGVSFDPAEREPVEAPAEGGTGLSRALGVALLLALAALGWALWHADYYLLPGVARPAHDKHALLRPGRGLGLAFGIASAALVALNLAYLLRRSAPARWRLGSLRVWMTSHVATGILAFLCALLHGALAPGATLGGHAFLALGVLLVTGALGRYLYSWVPRAANGRELALAETRARLDEVTAAWDRIGSPPAGGLGARARAAVASLVEERQWRSSLPGRLLALAGVERRLRRLQARLAREARAEGVAEERIAETLALARQAHRTALMAAHYEDLRALLGSWRWVHRWVAVLLVALLLLHVAFALAYGSPFVGGGSG